MFHAIHVSHIPQSQIFHVLFVSPSQFYHVQCIAFPHITPFIPHMQAELLQSAARALDHF
ncbi:hypothetical protein HK096_000401 [Nowakowskiella sp. JEL0078]|nr:hypothetical protein HK096_000401 [Nowakowskiella sp. JEL0078]